MIPVYQPYIATNQRKYVLDCLDSNMLTFRGKYVELFEKALADYLKVPHVISTFNGSVSIGMILHCLGIGQGDEVITQSLTYAATVSQINLSGATAVLVGSDEFLQMDLNQVEDCISKKTKAILVAQLYANSPDMQRLVAICESNNILLLEDSAEAFACSIGGKSIGTFGKASSFSFFANKIITGGELGCVCTSDTSLAKGMRLFRNQGHFGNYQHTIGSNLRSTNISTAIALSQLEEIDIILKNKKQIANFYREHLSPSIERIVPTVTSSSEWMPVFGLPHGLVYISFSEGCKDHGIEIRPCFTPIHLMSGFKTKFKSKNLKGCEQLYKNKFNLPSGPNLTQSQLKFIVETVNKLVE